jgi:hypothetical protein
METPSIKLCNLPLKWLGPVSKAGKTGPGLRHVQIVFFRIDIKADHIMPFKPHGIAI